MRELIQSTNSPCVRNCCLDENDICLGCFRSMEEIMRWSAADHRTRGDILKKSEERKRLARAKNI
ncbi:MAG: DUF1289 domain-containing protein [Pseudomonadales bacterium]|nr:DUF1289 domain-containing protein [Pseudomonadales bacterium]